MKKEPLLTIGVLGSLIGATIVLLQSFGVSITDAQSDALNNFFAIAIPIVIGIIGRQFVYSPATVDKIAADAAATGDQQVPPPPATNAVDRKRAIRDIANDPPDGTHRG